MRGIDESCEVGGDMHRHLQTQDGVTHGGKVSNAVIDDGNGQGHRMREKFSAPQYRQLTEKTAVHHL